MTAEQLTSFNAADKVVHPVEKEWHYPIFTKYGYEAITKEGIGFVRSFIYVHPISGNKVTYTTGYNSDYWNAKNAFGYWADLEPYLQKEASK